MKNYEFITNLRNNNAARVGAVVLVVAGVVGTGLLIEGSSNSNRLTNNDPTITQDQNNCNNFVNNHASKNMSIYNVESILPKEIITANNAPGVVRKYFGKNALAGDAQELAMIQAAIVIPSEKSTIDPVTGTPSKYNYLKSEQQVYNAMNGNKKLEEQACQDALKVMVKGGHYTSDFVQQGQKATQFVGVRNSEKEIVGYTTRVITVKANTVLSGIEFSAPKGSIGYDPVLIDGNGYLYIAGAMPESSTTSLKTHNNSGQTHEKALKQGTSSSNTGSGRKVNPGGPNSENQPTLISPNKLPAPSKSGGSPEAKPGSNNTPGPGGVSTTTTTEAIIPSTTTTTVIVPPTTTTTEATPPPSSTTTTTLPASKGPAPCDPNISAC